ncbi:MAG: efflux RND transporter permease subunit, partial [Devosia sp.]|nr:efflux RND transporter permease subunit [Devosia sp.]
MIRFFAAHPTASNLLMIGFLIMGLIAAPSLNRDTFPRPAPSRVEVSVAYPGARPEDVETAICERLEKALDAVSNVEKMSCESRENLGRATLQVVEGNSLDAFYADIVSEVEAISDFPDGAQAPVVKPVGRTDFVASITVSGINERAQLNAYADELRKRMLRWSGIPMVEVTGFSDRQYRVEVPADILRQLGLSVSDVARAIQRQNVDLPAGSITTVDDEMLVRVADERRNPLDYLDLVVLSGAKGAQVRLGDIAKVSEQFEQSEVNMQADGRPAAVLDISKTRNQDTLSVIDAVKAFLDHEREVAPPGIALSITQDNASIIRDRLLLVVTNGLQGLALVLVVLWLFFGLGFAFWVGMGLPVAFMGGIALMNMGGYSLDLMTTIGLLIVIGLLMDDAIVIAENIAAKREKGMTALDAVTEGARQVFPTVFASFATTTLVFGSLAFLNGDLGAVLKVVPADMLFVLAVSLVEAFLILPHHLLHVLEHPKAVTRWRRVIERGIDFTRDRLVGGLVDFTVRWRYATIGVAFAVLLTAVAMLAGGILKFTAFPQLDGDVIVARILLPQGTPLARTEAVVRQVEDALREVNGQLSPLQPDGVALVRQITTTFNENRDAFEAGAHVATVTADLLSGDRRNVRPDEIMARWREVTGDIADVISLKFAESTIGPAGIAIDMRLRGDNLADLKAASVELQDWLWRYRGVTSVLDDLRPGKREIRVHMKEGAITLGANAALVADQLRAAYYGTTTNQLQVEGTAFDVTVRLAEGDRGDLTVLDDFPIVLASGKIVPITTIAALEAGRGYARINRENGVRTLTVQGTIDTRIATANDIVNDTMAQFVPDLLARYPDLTLSLEGQNKEAQTTQISMIKGFALGLIGVFVVLSFQFRSYIEPIVVMLVIPFTLIGTIFGHLALGIQFSMPSMLGFVALAGVVVNDSIL